MSCNVRSSASGAVGAGADEDVHQTVHWTPPVTLQDTWSYCSGVQGVVCCVLQLVADYERLATVQHQTPTTTPPSEYITPFTVAIAQHSLFRSLITLLTYILSHFLAFLLTYSRTVLHIVSNKLIVLSYCLILLLTYIFAYQLTYFNTRSSTFYT